jgi:hypothetical protein
MMVSAKTPSELLREKLQMRAENADKVMKTPSQRKSENARKKAAKRAGVKYIETHYPCDCWKCPKEPCGSTLEQCKERSMVHRCKQCGAKVRHRVDEIIPWEYCPVCIAQV